MASVGKPEAATPPQAKSALDHKNEGNAHFIKRRFFPALACYTAALGDINGDDAIHAVLLSNRSSCFYEIGNYENAANDAKACIAMIDASTDPSTPLLCKNLWRLARALHYRNESSKDDEIHSVLERLQGVADEAFSSKATNTLEQLKYYDKYCSGGKTTVNFEPMPIRASFQNPYCEYYKFGHDVSESLLRHESIESQSIYLKDLNDEELSSISFLFGGVGDARHVMATLLDAHHQHLSLPSPKQEKLQLHITLNDISAQLLAKDALVLVMAHEIGRLAQDFETAAEEREPFFLGTAIMYITMGHAMPPSVHKKMIECIKLWFTESSHDHFLKAFPWLHMSAQTWEGVVAKMLAWVDPEKAYSPPLPSVRRTLLNLNPSDDSTNDMLSGLSMMGASSELMSDMQNKTAQAKEKAEKRRLQMIETIRTMELSPQMIDAAKSQLGEGASEEQIREFCADSLSSIPDDVFTKGTPAQFEYITPFDKLFFKMTHAILPSVQSPVQEINEDVAHFLEKPISSEKEAKEAVKHYKPTIHNTWVVNPVQTDPFFNAFQDGNVAPDQTNYVNDFPSMFLNDSVVSYMPAPPLSIINTKDQEKVRQSNTLTRNVIRYYWNVGKALNDLSGKVSLEIALGSIIALGANSKNRETFGLPTAYHRISLSNIPDYTGMLPVFCTIAPLLATKSDAITPSLRSNCLLNTGIWKTYDDYIFSTVSLSYKEAEAVFRLKVIDEEPSTWNSFTTWERADTNVDGLALSHEELRAWLHRLYLNIILPPDRDPNAQIREERASSVDLFLTTLSTCIHGLGLPAHFATSILEDFLAPKTLTTKATLSNDSPASISSRNNSAKKRYNLSAFQAELANRTAIFMQTSMLGVKLLSTKSLPVASASFYEMKIGGIETKFAQDWATSYGCLSGSAAMGFMLQKQRGTRYNLSSGASNGNINPMFMMMSMMPGGRGMPGMKKTPSKLRKALLDSGDAIGHVFSCMQWNLPTQTVSFWMCDDLFERFKNHAFTLIRTDGWFQIPHKDVILGDAKPSHWT